MERDATEDRYAVELTVTVTTVTDKLLIALVPPSPRLLLVDSTRLPPPVVAIYDFPLHINRLHFPRNGSDSGSDSHWNLDH